MALLNRPAPDRRRARGGAFVKLGVLAFAVLSLVGWTPVRAGGGGSLELAVKATYLYKLAPFISWPAAAFAAPNAPLVICVQGADPFGPVLDRATAGQAVGQRPVQVRRLPRLDASAGCQIAFVAGGAAQSQADALQAVAGAPVLTVTDGPPKSPAKGIVQLVLDGGKVRFAIDAGQADKNGVIISSKLLALAVAVKR